MTDDQGYGDLGCHGNRFSKPQTSINCIQNLFGYRFSCKSFLYPTRAALMTGNHQGVTGAYRTGAGRTMLHPSGKTIANHFAIMVTIQE